MHRDVKPHNVMIDHEKRKVRVSVEWNLQTSANITLAAPINRLGFGRVLPQRHRVQCSRRVTLLQGPRTPCRLPRV
jgi:hypothetical protein